MKEPKPIPHVPAALCGLFPGAHVDLAGNRYQATEEFEAGVWQFKYRTNHGVQYITMSCHDMALLLDSPLALCHAARWLAGRLGWDMRWIATAPTWERVRTGKGPEWVLRTRSNALYASDVPDISDLTDPAEALAAACVAVGGAK